MGMNSGLKDGYIGVTIVTSSMVTKLHQTRGSARFGSSGPGFPLAITGALPDNSAVVLKHCVPLQSRRIASDPSPHGPPIGGLGKGWACQRRRSLFLLRSPSNQKS